MQARLRSLKVFKLRIFKNYHHPLRVIIDYSKMLKIFLIRLLCLVVSSCDPKYKTPEILSTPTNRRDIARNVKIKHIAPIVKTRAGVVEGYLTKSMNGRNFFAFEGIPYGESTAGSRRWKPPIPKRAWVGVRSAKSPGTPCLQLDAIRLYKVHGSEDCLSLNVYTPNLPHPSSMDDQSYKMHPVIVFIHGGAFLLGSTKELGANYILNENVVLVTLNYRLGPLGFLSTGDHVIPGNYGLKDQALALKWVHENIKLFGGNSQNVTLFGQSVGGGSVHLHLIANKTREYFSTAYAASGTAFNHWVLQNSERIRELTKRLGEIFGCDTRQSRVLSRCLRKIDPNFLVAAQFNLYGWFPFPGVLFSPTVEPPHPDAFLTTWPSESYKAGSVASKPFIIGLTKSEGKSIMLALIPMMKTFPLRVMWDQIAPYYLEYKNLVDHPDRTTKKVSEFYFKGISPRRANLDVFVNMLSDRVENFGVVNGIQAHVKSGAPTYFSYFSFSDGNHNSGNFLGYKSSEWGAGHGEDLFYFFNLTQLTDSHKHSDPDHELSEIMIKLLVNFAETGKPTYTTESGKVYHIWEPVINASDIKGIQFDKKVEMIDLPKSVVDGLKFWDSLHLTNTSLLSPL